VQIQYLCSARLTKLQIAGPTPDSGFGLGHWDSSRKWASRVQAGPQHTRQKPHYG
jgi:hypothetical protein